MPVLRLPFVFLAAAAVATGPAPAAEPFRLLNINRTPAEVESSRPRQFYTLGDLALFVADDPRLGTELFVSDGTKAGTRVLTDLCPGTCSSYPRMFWVAGGLLYFRAAPVADETWDGLHVESRRFLWRTDGTEDGTVRLGEVVPGLRESFGPDEFDGRLGELPGGRVVFVGADPAHGEEPWITDGTPSGTRLLADIVPGPQSSGIFSQLVDIPDRAGVTIGDRVVFVAGDFEHWFEPWVTDGTTSGTRLLRDVLPGPENSDPYQLGTAGGLAFFSAADGVHGRELWASDGTPGGTRMVADLTPGPESTDFPSTRTGIDGPGDRAYFLAAVAGARPELWTTDGTAAGTRKLTAFTPALGFPRLVQGGLLDNYGLTWFEPLFTGAGPLFWADDGIRGLDLWRTDGRAAGTRPFLDLCPGPCDGFPFLVSQLALDPSASGGGELAFAAADEEHGRELWATDGTVAGTRRVTDTCPGSCSGTPTNLHQHEGDLLFLAWNGKSRELWSLSGSSATARELTALGEGAFEVDTVSGPRSRLQGAAAGERFVFAAVHPDHGYELWRTDGTLAGTDVLEDLAASLDQGSHPRGYTLLGDRVYFLAREEEDFAPLGLWVTDGTAAGTRRFLAPGTRERTRLTAAGDRLYFIEPPPSADRILWSVAADGADLRQVAQIAIREGDFSGDEVMLAELGGRLLFNTHEGFWATDGGAEPPAFLGGVGVVAWSGFSVDPGPRVATAGADLFVLARESFDHPLGLWRLDGTPEGTKLLAGGGGPGPVPGGRTIAGFGENAYFFSLGEDGDCALWRSNGTASGTREVTVVPLARTGFCPERMIATSDRVFSTTVGTVGDGKTPLWTSDGTAAGTRVVLEDLTLGASDFPFFTEALPRALVFVHSDPAHGGELWVSDGTPRGTHLLADLRPGPLSSRPAVVAVHGDHLFFTAYDEEHGRQLWRTDGTRSGTVRLTDAFPPSAGLHESTAILGDLFLFTASDGFTGQEPWALDTSDGGEPPPPPPPPPSDDPPPPAGPWLQAPEIPGFRFKVRIAQGSGASLPGAAEPDCIPETLCVSGALAGRSEVFLRVVGPKPNGKLWPTLVKFTTSEVEVWIEQLFSGDIRYYRLEGAGPGSSELPGLFDRDGFDP